MQETSKANQLFSSAKRYAGVDVGYVAKGGFWIIFGKIIAGLASAAILYAFANWAPKETYGVYSYVLSIATLLGIFALPGINSAMSVAISRGNEGMLGQAAKIKFKWSLIGSFIATVISAWYLFNENYDLGIAFLLVALSLPFLDTFNELVLRFWQGRQNFRALSFYTIIFQVLVALGVIATIFVTDNPLYAISAFLISQVLWGTIIFFVTYKQTNNNKTDKETVAFGKHLTAMNSLELISGQADKILLWHLLGPVPLAIYSFAKLPISKLEQLIPIQQLALPKLSIKSPDEIKRSVLVKFYKLFFVSIFAASILFTATTPIYTTFFPAYTQSIPVFQALLILLILAPVSLLKTGFIAGANIKELYLARSIPSILQLILLVILAPIYGIWGLVWAAIAARIFGSGLTLYLFLKL